MTQEEYKSGNKLLWLQVHNILPIFMILALEAFNIMLIAGISDTVKQIVDTRSENIKGYQVALKDQQAQINKLQVQISELDKKPSPTPTVSIRRITPTPEAR